MFLSSRRVARPKGSGILDWAKSAWDRGVSKVGTFLGKLGDVATSLKDKTRAVLGIPRTLPSAPGPDRPWTRPHGPPNLPRAGPGGPAGPGARGPGSPGGPGARGPPRDPTSGIEGRTVAERIEAARGRQAFADLEAEDARAAWERQADLQARGREWREEQQGGPRSAAYATQTQTPSLPAGTRRRPRGNPWEDLEAPSPPQPRARPPRRPTRGQWSGREGVFPPPEDPGTGVFPPGE